MKTLERDEARRRRGQAVVEFLLLLSLVAIVAIVSLAVVGTGMKGAYDRASDQVEDATGGIRVEYEEPAGLAEEESPSAPEEESAAAGDEAGRAQRRSKS